MSIFNDELIEAYNKYFYWFSHFEYALKEQKYLKNENKGDKAEPGWDKFVQAKYEVYTLSKNAKKLIALNPKKQVVCSDKELDWEDLNLDNYKCGMSKRSDLCTIVTMLKTVRNNLFHGGKHDKSVLSERNKELVITSIAILKELAEVAQFGEDYPLG